MAYSKVHSRHELGNLIFYEDGNRQRWLDAIGPNAIVFKEDFAGDITANWTGTEVDATAGVASYDAEGGAILLFGAGADGDGYQIQKLEGFKTIADCPIYFGVRWKFVGDMGPGSVSVLMGLAPIDSTLLDHPDDGVYFSSASAVTALNLTLSIDGAETDATVLTTLVNGTWYIDEFYWDGDDTVKAWHDGAFVASGSAASMDQTQRYGVSLAYQAQKSAASSGVGLVVDWVRAIQLLDVRNA